MLTLPKKQNEKMKKFINLLKGATNSGIVMVDNICEMTEEAGKLMHTCKNIIYIIWDRDLLNFNQHQFL